MSLDRNAILAFRDSRLGRVNVPELGGEVCVASLTAAEADKLARMDGESYPVSVGVVILAACAEDGSRLFTEKDAEKLSALPASVMKTIADAAMDHNGLGAGAKEDAKND